MGRTLLAWGFNFTRVGPSVRIFVDDVGENLELVEFEFFSEVR